MFGDKVVHCPNRRTNVAGFLPPRGDQHEPLLDVNSDRLPRGERSGPWTGSHPRQLLGPQVSRIVDHSEDRAAVIYFTHE